MSDARTELADAEIKSREARERLTATLVNIQSRVNPKALAREALVDIRDAGAEALRTGLAAAKRNPGSIMAIGATLVALFARGWIADIIALKPTATVKTDARLATRKTASQKE